MGQLFETKWESWSLKLRRNSRKTWGRSNLTPEKKDTSAPQYFIQKLFETKNIENSNTIKSKLRFWYTNNQTKSKLFFWSWSECLYIRIFGFFVSPFKFLHSLWVFVYQFEYCSDSSDNDNCNDYNNNWNDNNNDNNEKMITMITVGIVIIIVIIAIIILIIVIIMKKSKINDWTVIIISFSFFDSSSSRFLSIADYRLFLSNLVSNFN